MSQLNNLEVFPTFFSLNLNFAVRRSWSESQSAPSLVFADYVNCLHLQLQRISVQFSHSAVSNSLWSHGLQHNRPPCPSPTPRVYSHSYSLSQWCRPKLSSPSPPAFNLHQGFFQWVSSSHQVAKVLEFQLQHQSFQWIFGADFL